MTPEQLNWSDKQWAGYFKCPVHEVLSIKKYMTENFFPVIEQDKNTGKYNFTITRLDTSIAGTKRVLPMVSDKKKFSSYSDAVKHANNTVIPKLELTQFWASALNVPKFALQMLHIKER